MSVVKEAELFEKAAAVILLVAVIFMAIEVIR